MGNTPPVIIFNQELVREKLRQKKYDDVCLSGWGHLDEFVNFIITFGILDMLAQLGLTTGHSGIPVCLLAMLAFAKPLFGIRFDDNVKYLFQDHHVMRLLGFNSRHIELGYSKRTREDGSKPILGRPNQLSSLERFLVLGSGGEHSYVCERPFHGLWLPLWHLASGPDGCG